VPTGLPGTRTRPPAVAGAFYPRDPGQLERQVLDLLAETTVSPNVAPKALIAPHCTATELNGLHVNPYLPASPSNPALLNDAALEASHQRPLSALRRAA
jgi:MEMO1 family protein